MKVLLVLCVTLSAAWATPPWDGTIFIDPDIITESDPSGFDSLTAAGQAPRIMFDRRLDAFETFEPYLFNAGFADGPDIEIQVNPEFGSVAAAQQQAALYAPIIGRLPLGLRQDVETVWIHRGDEAFGGGNRNLLIHTGSLAQSYLQDGIIEEVLVHEAAHTSLDSNHAISTGWLTAQLLDPDYISQYAKDHPLREDIAESVLPWLAVTYRRDRIDAAMAETIEQTIPHRLAYLSDQSLDMSLVDAEAVRTAENNQFWIVGLAEFSVATQRLTLTEALSTSGTSFGDDFNPDDVIRTPWGSITIQFTSCTTADLSWEANAANAEFGSGGYSMVRLARNDGQQECERDGFGLDDDNDWITGTWFGGGARSGEGLVLDPLLNGQVFLTWFTFGAAVSETQAGTGVPR